MFMSNSLQSDPPPAAGSRAPSRRQQLGEFLRERRTRLTPDAVGLAPRPATSRRRRTPGLRREEVADLAQVGLSWYTWLEQGRDINPSRAVLERVARSLRLSDDETTYLLQLAGHAAPPRDATDTVSASLQRVLDGMSGIPAYIVNRRWDRVAWNRPALALLGNFAADPPPLQNILRRVFTHPETRRYVGDWESMAHSVLSEFRASCARFPDDPAVQALVDELMQTSEEFRAWWPKRDVLERRTKRATIVHALTGPIEFEVSTFIVPDRPGLTLYMYMVLQDGTSPARLSRVIEAFQPA
jgi:transcriptional regulator with XRE-family HTH domain